MLNILENYLAIEMTCQLRSKLVTYMTFMLVSNLVTPLLYLGDSVVIEATHVLGNYLSR